MASLDPTERAKVALAAGESLRVTTAGQCTVQGLTGAPSTTTTLTANSQNFGPYGVSAVLLITGVSGRSEYSLNVPAASGGAVPGDGIPFASFQPAASAGLGALQWESVFGVLLRSDGTYWRPAGGHQMLRNLAADWVMSTPSSALQVCDSFDIPAGMLPPGAALEAVIGFDKLGGTSDTFTVRLKLGGTSVVLPALASTSISAGTLQRFKRVSATTVQRVGGGNAAAIGALSSTSTSARPAAITVQDLDANALTVELSGQMTTGSTEYGVIHHYTLFLVG